MINSTHRFAAADQTDVTFLFLDPGIENIYRLRHGLKYSYCLPDLRLDRKRIRVENDNLVKELRMIGEPVSHITNSPYDEYWLEKVVSSSEVSNFGLTAAAHPREKQKKYRYLRQANTNLVPSHAIGFVSIKLLELWLLGVKAVAIDIDIEDSF